MNKNALIGISLGILLGLLVPHLVLAQSAGDGKPYGDLNGEPPKLGEFAPYLLLRIWDFAQKIFVAMALIMGMFLVYKTFTNRENPKALEELPQKWLYLAVFGILAFGAGGTILNFIFKLFGFGTLNDWINPVNKIFDQWIKMTDGF